MRAPRGDTIWYLLKRRDGTSCCSCVAGLSSSILQPEHSSVPCNRQRRSHPWTHDLRSPTDVPSRKLNKPIVFPREAWLVNALTKLFSDVLQLPSEIDTVWVELMQPGPDVPDTCRSCSLSIFQRAKARDVKCHGEKQRFQLLIRSADVTDRFESCGAVVGLRFRNKSNTITRKNHPAKILAIIVPPQSCIPGAGGFRKLSADQPIVRLHVQVVPHLP